MARLVAIRLAPMWSFCACQDHQPAIAAMTSDAPPPRTARQRNQLRSDMERPVRRTFDPSGFVRELRILPLFVSMHAPKKDGVRGTQETAARLDRCPDSSEMRKGRFGCYLVIDA